MKFALEILAEQTKGAPPDPLRYIVSAQPRLAAITVKLIIGEVIFVKTKVLKPLFFRRVYERNYKKCCRDLSGRQRRKIEVAAADSKQLVIGR